MTIRVETLLQTAGLGNGSGIVLLFHLKLFNCIFESAEIVCNWQLFLLISISMSLWCYLDSSRCYAWNCNCDFWRAFQRSIQITQELSLNSVNCADSSHLSPLVRCLIVPERYLTFLAGSALLSWACELSYPARGNATPSSPHAHRSEVSSQSRCHPPSPGVSLNFRTIKHGGGA